MAEPKLPETTIELAEDRLSAKLTLGRESFAVDAPGLENFIGHLGHLRSEMQPAVGPRSPDGGQFLHVAASNIEIVESNDAAAVRIALRTPTYGWIGFQFTPAQAAEIGRHLVATYGPRVAANGAPGAADPASAGT